MIRALVLFLAFLPLIGCKSTGAGAPPQEELDVALSFEGYEVQDVGRLGELARSEIASHEAARPDKAVIDDVAFALELFYLAHGHPFAEVDYEYEDVAGSPVRAHFEITEGALVTVGSLEIRGNQSYDDARLRSFFGSAARGGVFVQDEIDTGRRALVDFYRQLGHARARIEQPVVEIDEETNRATVVVVVEEGVQHIVSTLHVAGGLSELRVDLGHLETQFLGRPLTPRLAYAARALMVEAYSRRGYPDCEAAVEARVDEATGAVELAFTVVPGPRIIVSEIRITGNEDTRESVIRSHLPIKEGDRYDSAKVAVGSRQLYRTGLFQSVRITLEGEGDGDRLLLVEVEEVASLEVRLEPGWGSYEGPRFQVSVDELNFRGTGHRLSLTGSVSARALTARLGLLDQHFLGTPFSLSTALFALNREQPSYEVTEVGIGVFGSRVWQDRYRASLGYEFRLNELRQVDVMVPLPPGFSEDPNVGAIIGRLDLDGRDSFLLPKRGQRLRTDVEFANEALGAQIDYLRSSVEYSRVFSVRGKTSLAGRIRLGTIAPLGGTQVIPIYEREFNGGDDSVRSFREDQLGPKDLNGNPIGGEGSTIFSLEARRDLVGSFAGAAFADAGNVVIDISDYLSFPNIRYGVGVGLRYLLPVGPVRLDFAWNPDARFNEDDFVLHFSVGLPF